MIKKEKSKLVDSITVAGATTSAGPKLRILIAEDHVVNQEVLKVILSQYGYGFTVVANGHEVMESLAQQEFDVILMDMQMPVMDGCQAAREIRKREEIAGGHIRIIAITANAMEQDREICLAAGMDDYITKPIEAQTLIRKLNWNGLQGFESTQLEQQPLSVANASIFNADSLKGRVLGQSIPSKKMAQMFLKDLPNALANFDLALSANDIDGIAKQAHRIGGVAAMMGAEQFALIAEELEADACVGATKTLAGLVAKMHLAAIPLKEQLLQFVIEN